MQYDEFIGLVRKWAGLGSSAEAKKVTQATLSTIGKYLVGYEGRGLASQLPQGVAEHLRREPPDRPMIYSLPDFLQEIDEREDVTPMRPVSMLKPLCAFHGRRSARVRWRTPVGSSRASLIPSSNKVIQASGD